MIYLIQIIKMLNKKQCQRFIALFNDLSFEIEEMGYDGMETELVSDMLFNHFGLEMQDENQLHMLTNCILKHQKRLDNFVNLMIVRLGIDVA